MKNLQKDINDSGSVIPVINTENHRELLAKNIISDGMVPKLHNAMNAIQSGVTDVRITNYMTLDKGTLIQA